MLRYFQEIKLKFFITFFLAFVIFIFPVFSEDLEDIFSEIKKRDYYDKEESQQYAEAINKLIAKGRRDLAIEEFKKGILYDPSLAGINNGELLTEAYQQINERQNDSEATLFLSGYLGYLSGDYDNAQNTIEQLISISNDGDILEECNQLMETITEEKAIWSKPDEPLKAKIEYLFGLTYSYTKELLIVPPNIVQWLANSEFNYLISKKIRAYSININDSLFPVNIIMLKKADIGNCIWGIFSEKGDFLGKIKGGILLARKHGQNNFPEYEVMLNLPQKSADVKLYRFDSIKGYHQIKARKISGGQYRQYLQSRSILLKKLNPSK